MVELARLMKREMELSVPVQLKPGEWHLPYVETVHHRVTNDVLYFADGQLCSLEEARLISISCCAQVSYRSLDMGIDKAKRIVARLADRDDPHLSPFEHQATPMYTPVWHYPDNLEYKPGVTHVDSGGNFWSGNFQGWIQNRQVVDL